MNPKSGKAGSPVVPTEPEKAAAADNAKAGSVASAQAKEDKAKAGQYGKTEVKPHKPPQTPEEKEEKKSWVEIELVDHDNQPIPGEKYRVTLPDGSVAEGTLDGKGYARINGVEPGQCQITFPNLDKDAWKSA